MKMLSRCLLVVLSIALVKAQSQIGNVRSISSGTSFGMCRGYCQQSINVTSLPSQLTATKQANFAQPTYPLVQRSFAFPAPQWDQLIGLVDLKTFQALGASIGCPDCADGGAEWIQIDGTDGNKRVTFENGRTVKGIEALIEKLRQVRNDYLTRL
jgi:hypothetical protein